MGSSQSSADAVASRVGITPAYGEFEPVLGQVVKYGVDGFGFLPIPELDVSTVPGLPQLDKDDMRRGTELVHHGEARKDELGTLRTAVESRGFTVRHSLAQSFVSSSARSLRFSIDATANTGAAGAAVPVAATLHSAFAYVYQSGIACRAVDCFQAVLNLDDAHHSAIFGFLERNYRKLRAGRYAVVIGKAYAYESSFQSGTANSYTVSDELRIKVVDDQALGGGVSFRMRDFVFSSVTTSGIGLSCVGYSVINFKINWLGSFKVVGALRVPTAEGEDAPPLFTVEEKDSHGSQLEGPPLNESPAATGIAQGSPSGSAAASTARPRRRALLIGIDHYNQQPLAGCVNDVKRVAHVLNSRFGVDCLVLPEASCFKRTVTGLLRSYAQTTASDEAFLFYFSGHGSQQRNANKHNGTNETFVCLDEAVDWPTKNSHHITDDELATILRDFKTKNLTLIFDSCHSGDIHRETTVRDIGLEPSARCIRAVGMLDAHESAELSPLRQMAAARDASGSGLNSLGSFQYVVASACLDREVAREWNYAWHDPDTRLMRSAIHGNFTHALCTLLESRPAAEISALSWRDIFAELPNELPSWSGVTKQHPQLEGLRDWLFLGNKASPFGQRVALILPPAPAPPTLCAGVVHGVGVGSRWTQAVEFGGSSRSSATNTTPASRSNLEMTGMERGVFSTLRVTGAPPVRSPLFARCVAHYFGNQPVRVLLDHSLSTVGEVRQQCVRYLAASIHAVPLTEGDSSASSTASATPSFTLKLSADNRRLELRQVEDLKALAGHCRHQAWIDAALDEQEQELKEKDLVTFFANCSKIIRNYGLLTRVSAKAHLLAPLTVQQFKFTIAYKPPTHDSYDPEQPLQSGLVIGEGEQFGVQFRNGSSSAVYLTWLEFGATSRVCVQYPPPGGHNTVVAAGHHMFPQPARVTVTMPELATIAADGNSRDVWRFILSTDGTDCSFLQQDGLQPVMPGFAGAPPVRGEREFEVLFPNSAPPEHRGYAVCDYVLHVRPRSSSRLMAALTGNFDWAQPWDPHRFVQLRQGILKMAAQHVRIGSLYQLEEDYCTTRVEELIDTQAVQCGEPPLPPTQPRLIVLLVHGCLGGHRSTWTNSNRRLWPAWLASHSGLPVRLLTVLHALPLGYQSIDEAVADVINALAAEPSVQADSTPLLWVCHGIGGLLVKALLHNDEAINQRTVGVAFYGTAHDAVGTSLVHGLLSGMQWRDDEVSLDAFGTKTRQIDSNFRASCSHMPILSFVELRKTRMVTVTAPPAARAICDDWPGRRMEPVLVGEDHINLCKPALVSDAAYVRLEEFVRMELTNLGKAAEDDLPPPPHGSAGVRDSPAESLAPPATEQSLPIEKISNAPAAGFRTVTVPSVETATASVTNYSSAAPISALPAAQSILRNEKISWQATQGLFIAATDPVSAVGTAAGGSAVSQLSERGHGSPQVFGLAAPGFVGGSGGSPTRIAGDLAAFSPFALDLLLKRCRRAVTDLRAQHLQYDGSVMPTWHAIMRVMLEAPPDVAECALLPNNHPRQVLPRLIAFIHTIQFSCWYGGKLDMLTTAIEQVNNLGVRTYVQQFFLGLLYLARGVLGLSTGAGTRYMEDYELSEPILQPYETMVVGISPEYGHLLRWARQFLYVFTGDTDKLISYFRALKDVGHISEMRIQHSLFPPPHISEKQRRELETLCAELQSPPIPASACLLSTVLRALGHFDDALHALDSEILDAWSLTRRAHPNQHDSRRFCLINKGNLLLEQRRWEDSFHSYLASVALCYGDEASNSIDIVRIAPSMGFCLLGLGYEDAALALFLSANEHSEIYFRVLCLYGEAVVVRQPHAIEQLLLAADSFRMMKNVDAALQHPAQVMGPTEIVVRAFDLGQEFYQEIGESVKAAACAEFLRGAGAHLPNTRSDNPVSFIADFAIPWHTLLDNSACFYFSVSHHAIYGCSLLCFLLVKDNDGCKLYSHKQRIAQPALFEGQVSHTRDYQRHLTEYSRLLFPSELVSAVPEGVRRLYIVPQGVIFALPFNEMQWGAVTLGDRFSFTVLVSLTSLMRLGAESQQPGAVPPTEENAEEEPMVVALLGDPVHTAATHLPCVRPELNAINDLFTTHGALVLTHLARDFSEAAVIREVAESAALVHVSSHNAAVEATEYFKPGGGILCSENFVLTAQSVFEQPWDLTNCRLLVLALCDAVSGNATLSQGLLGLTYTFVRCGARAVVVAAYPVDDQGTMELMKRLYALLLQGHSPADALWEIRRERAAIVVGERQQRVFRDATVTFDTPVRFVDPSRLFFVIGDGFTPVIRASTQPL